MAVKRNLNVDQGSEFTAVWNISSDGIDFDLTGYTANIDVRAGYNSKKTILSFSTSGANPNITFPSPATQGQLVLKIPAAQTEVLQIDCASVDLVYDLEIVLGNITYRISQGIFKISKEVTKV